jgi:endonuclease
MKRFNVVIPKDDGGIELHPMKEWLRQHPEYVPTNHDATQSTSHTLRNALKKLGWTVQESATEVRLLMPGVPLLATNLESILGSVDESEENDDVETAEAAFGLEYQLRDFIAQNLEAIPVEGRKLKLYVDPTGRDGVEYPTAVGPIDILAIDELENFIVFELKRARSPDHTIGQLSRYMGWVKRTIGAGKSVKGVIVARAISDNLKYAIGVIPHVSLFEYQVSFKLNSAHDLPS